MDEHRHADALDDFLDRLVFGQDDRALGVDTDLVQIVRRYRTLGSSPAPRGSRERVWRTVQARADRSSPREAGPMAHAGEGPLAQSMLPANELGDLADVGRAPWHRAATLVPPWRRVLPSLATAAIVLLTLLCSFVVFGPRRFWTPVTPAAPPALVIASTPEMPIKTETLMDEPVTSLPFGHAIIGVDRWVLQPSSKPLALPPFGGQAVIAAETGEVLATLFDAPKAPTELRLEPGETILPASDQDVSLQVPGRTTLSRSSSTPARPSKANSRSRTRPPTRSMR